ncbi:AAA domain-containing protein [Nocardioides albertanoniae]|uniref:AAA domain-containing protein n=1 Tax=Nocardioides albertanoniae TaxID=1175486 RepID=A0A543A1X1_9ACTN|nr:AAA family ATPase [Nocardioides albertanoniae]TQL66577.1 AAA domain-containing protein [Nocardioides albertanoniae]
MARLILINGMPGVGKSTLARRFAADHPGTLVCDIDLLRTFISGWRGDFVGAGARIRPAALGMIRGYLRESGDVVLPQLLARLSELERFEKAAHDAGAEFVEVLIEAAEDDGVRRFHDRDDGNDPWHPIVRDIVWESGGDEHLRVYVSKLADLRAQRPATKVIPSVAGEVDATYASLRTALDGC